MTPDWLFEEGEPTPREATHPAALEEASLMKQCRLSRGRSGGPGGQHRNKTETQVVLEHEPTGVSAQAGERRSPEANRRAAMRRLRLALATEVREAIPAGEARSRLWMERTHGGRIELNEKHWDFPAMLAEAMDVLAACRWDHKRAAVRLEVTPSQLVRLLAAHPPALQRANAQRAAAGLRPLRG